MTRQWRQKHVNKTNDRKVKFVRSLESTMRLYRQQYFFSVCSGDYI